MLEQVAQLGVESESSSSFPSGWGSRRFIRILQLPSACVTSSASSETTTMVLGIGRLIEWKGFDYLIDALRIVRERGGERAPRHRGRRRFALRAHAADRATRPRTARSRSWERWPRADVPAYYAAADLVAIPSIRHDAGFVEGLGYVALEALASGTPIVASDVGGLGETVRDGEVGMLVDERDPEALAAAILHLAADPALRARLGANARARALAAPSWDEVAARWVETYQEVAARPSPSSSKLKASSERFDATRHETTEDVVMGLYHRYSYELAAESARLDVRASSTSGSAKVTGRPSSRVTYQESSSIRRSWRTPNHGTQVASRRTTAYDCQTARSISLSSSM